jgi:hypothetical protein
MTKLELYEIDRRIDEINRIVNECDPTWDDGVLANLDAELEVLETKVLMVVNETKRSKLTLIKGER